MLVAFLVHMAFVWCAACLCLRLQALVDAGPTPPPGETGAKFIIRKDGRRINLAFLRDGASRALEVGGGAGLRAAAQTERASEARCAALQRSPAPHVLQQCYAGLAWLVGALRMQDDGCPPADTGGVSARGAPACSSCL